MVFSLGFVVGFVVAILWAGIGILLKMKKGNVAILDYDKKKGQYQIFGDAKSLYDRVLHAEKYGKPGSVKYID